MMIFGSGDICMWREYSNVQINHTSVENKLELLLIVHLLITNYDTFVHYSVKYGVQILRLNWQANENNDIKHEIGTISL